MNVVVPLCFASHRVLCAIYWKFHVLRRTTAHLNTCHHTASHLIIGHYITSIHLTTPRHTTSRNFLHHHHRHNTETQPDTTKTPPVDGMAESWCEQNLGLATALVGRPADISQANSFFRVFFCLLKRPPRLARRCLYTGIAGMLGMFSMLGMLGFTSLSSCHVSNT